MASLSQGRTAAAQCSLFTHKSVPVIFEPPCTLVRSVHTIGKHIKTLVVAVRRVGLELNADQTKNIVMSRDQYAGQSHSTKTDNSSIERVKQFYHKLNETKFYSGRNYEQIEVRECLLSFGAESLSSSLLSKNVKVKIYRTIILPVVFYGCEI